MCVIAAVISFALGDAAPVLGQSTVTVVLAPRVFTGRVFVENVAIIIDRGVIMDVVDLDAYAPIQGARVIDAAGMTVTPGFIDSHVHVLGQPLEVVKNTAQRGWGRLAEEAISQVPGNREQLLKSGITAVIDMGSTIPGMLGLAEGLRTGKLLGPELFYCGPLFTAPNGHPAGTIYKGQHELIDNATVQVNQPGPAFAKIAELSGQGASFVKIVYDDGTFYGSKVPRLDQGLAAQIVAEAHSRGLPVIAHVGATEGAFSDMLVCGVDGVEHCFAFNGSDAVFKEAAARGVVFTPTLSIYEMYATAVMPRMMQSVTKAHEDGVVIAAGTDFPSSKYMTAGEGFYRELALLEEAGLSRAEVLQAATYNGARKIRKEGEIGSVAAGHAANLLFFEGDVRDGALGPQRIRRVMLRGKDVVVDGSVPDERRSGLGRQPVMVFPFGFYDMLSGVSVGANAFDFNLFGTGAAIGLTASYSFTNCFAADLTVSSPSPIPLTALDFRVGFDGYPRRFFGMGNTTALANVIRYDSTDFKASVATNTALVPALKLSTMLLLDWAAIGSYQGRNLPEVTGSNAGIVTLARAEVAHDTRDMPSAPWYGDYEAVGGSVSSPLVGSKYSFSSVDLDLRYFLSIAHNHVLAGRVFLTQAFGDPPFYFMPSFGGLTLGRGYQPARFIDTFGAFGQLEYRFPIWSIMGGDLFLDAGQLCANPTQLSADAFHLAGGAGMRFTFSERWILSFDVGFNGEPISPEGFVIIVRTGHAF